MSKILRFNNRPDSGFIPIIVAIVLFFLLMLGAISIVNSSLILDRLCGENVPLSQCFNSKVFQNSKPSDIKKGQATLTLNLSDMSKSPAKLSLDYDKKSLSGVVPIVIQGQTVSLNIKGSVDPSSGELKSSVSGNATFTGSNGQNSVTSQATYSGTLSGIITASSRANGNLYLIQTSTVQSSNIKALVGTSKTDTTQLTWEGGVSK